jgi:hypothetical protein
MMARCDLCDAHCDADEMAQLRPLYRVPGVGDLCPACTRWADKTKNDITDTIAPQMRAAVAARKGARPSWWRRLLGWLAPR